MAHIGHILGPRKSELIESKGNTYFGCSEEDYYFDLAAERDTEGLAWSGSILSGLYVNTISSGKAEKIEHSGGAISYFLGKNAQITIEPVHVDEEGRPYTIWAAPNRGSQREYLEKYLDPIFVRNQNEQLITYTPDDEERYKERIKKLTT